MDTISELRKESNRYGLGQLAREAGISKVTAWKFRTGRTPQVKAVVCDRIRDAIERLKATRRVETIRDSRTDA